MYDSSSFELSISNLVSNCLGHIQHAVFDAVRLGSHLTLAAPPLGMVLDGFCVSEIALGLNASPFGAGRCGAMMDLLPSFTRPLRNSSNEGQRTT